MDDVAPFYFLGILAIGLGLLLLPVGLGLVLVAFRQGASVRSVVLSVLGSVGAVGEKSPTAARSAEDGRDRPGSARIKFDNTPSCSGLISKTTPPHSARLTASDRFVGPFASCRSG